MANKRAKKGGKKGKRLLLIGAAKYRESTVKSLIKQGEAVFDSVLFVPITKIRLSSVNGQNHLYYKDVDLLSFDACYPRIRASDYALGEALLDVLENSEVYTPVSLRGFQISNHKYYTVQKLAKAGVPVVLSALSTSSEGMETIKEQLGMPLVIKLISGFAGKGVMLIEDDKQLDSILDAIHLFEDYISSQKYVPGANKDIRCYVLGEKVIAVQRIGRPGDFRANISRGGSAEVVEITPEMKEMSLKAARAVDMDICAVDLIELGKGTGKYAVIEINFQPGPFMKYLGETMTTEMVNYLYEKVK